MAKFKIKIVATAVVELDTEWYDEKPTPESFVQSTLEQLCDGDMSAGEVFDWAGDKDAPIEYSCELVPTENTDANG